MARQRPAHRADAARPGAAGEPRVPPIAGGSPVKAGSTQIMAHDCKRTETRLYQVILGDMNSTRRSLAVAADLARVSMLAHVPSESLHQLAQAHPVRNFTSGSILLHQGMPATHLLIMLDGQASAVVDHAAGVRSRYPLMTALAGGRQRG